MLTCVAYGIAAHEISSTLSCLGVTQEHNVNRAHKSPQLRTEHGASRNGVCTNIGPIDKVHLCVMTGGKVSCEGKIWNIGQLAGGDY